MKLRLPRLIALILVSLPFLVTAACTSAKVSISSLSISPDKTSPNTPVVVAANVLSYAQKPLDYKIELRVKGKVQETKTVQLQPGETQTVSFQFAPSEIGAFDIDVNGQKSIINAVRPAEFSVTDFSISPTTLVAGDNITLTADVKNTGEMEGTYTALLKVDDLETGTKEVIVAPSGSAAASVSFQVNDGGTHVLNFAGVSKSVKVFTPAKFEASSLTISPSSILPGQSASAEVSVKNTGELSATMPVNITLDGQSLGSQTLTLDPGASQKVSFSLNPTAPGSKNVSILGVSATLSVTKLEAYSSKTFGYEIMYPPGLEVDEIEGGVWIGNSSGTVGIQAGVNKVAVGDTARSVVDKKLDQSKKLNPTFTSSSLTDIVEANRTVGYKFDYSINESNVKWKGRAAIIVKAGTVFLLDYGSEPSEWERQRSTASFSIDNFKTPAVFAGQYSNSSLGLSLSLPTEWSLAELSSRSLPLVFFSPYNKPLVHGVIGIESVGSGVTAQQYVSAMRAGIASDGAQTTPEVQFQFPQAAGYEFSAQWTSGISERVFVMVSGGKAYFLIFAGSNSGLSTGSSEIAQLARSLSAGGATSTGTNRNETLVLAESEIPTLDPARTEDGPGGIVGALFSGLVKIDPSFKPVPDLAERWTVSSDGITYTFQLRQSAKFQDGRQVTAKDVKYSWERACSPATASPKAASFLNDIKGARDVMSGKASSISGVKVIDSSTVEVTLEAPRVYFLSKLAQPVAFIVDESNVQKGTSWYEKPNGTGAFKLKEWVKDDRLVLERNDAFYATQAKLKYIYFDLFAGDSMSLYESGTLDITGVSNTNLEKVLDITNPLNKDLRTGNSFSNAYIALNLAKPPFDDPKVRQAFAQALDVDKLIQVALKGRADRAAGYVPSGVPAFNSSLAPIPFDPSQAKNLIAQSKYKSVDQLPQITAYVPYGVSAYQQAIIGMWQQNLGVTVRVEAVSSYEEFYERSHKDEFQVAFHGWRADYVDPQNFLDLLFQSQSPENGMSYSNPAVDTALVDAAAEKDEAARWKKYQEIEKQILADIPAIPTYRNSKSYLLVKPYVQGYTLHPIDINIWTEISLLPH